MKILLAEDNKKLGALIKYVLEEVKNQVDWFSEGASAWGAIQKQRYDVVILDWMIPKLSGVEICEALREEGNHTPVLLLTARDTVEDRVIGLEFGADDYLVKPFEFTELLARVNALQRRSNWQVDSQVTQVGQIGIHRLEKKINLAGEEIQMTTKEFQLLDLLVQNLGMTLPRELMIERIWGWEVEITPNNLDAHIRRLRKKIDFSKAQLTLHTVHGIGYRLEKKNV